jgi:hypothetical protein
MDNYYNDKYNHDNSEAFCKYCGNTSLNDKDMCKLCYDDLNILFHCYICNNYYNYENIENICIKYIYSSNIIKKYYKKYYKKYFN